MDAYIRSLFDASVSEEYILNFRKIITYLVRANSKNITLNEKGEVPLFSYLSIVIYGGLDSGKHFFVYLLQKYFKNYYLLDEIIDRLEDMLDKKEKFDGTYIVDTGGKIFKTINNTSIDLKIEVYDPKVLSLKKMITVINEEDFSTIKEEHKRRIVPIHFPNTFKYLPIEDVSKSFKFTPKEFRDYFNVPVDIDELQELRRYFQKLIH